MQTGSKASETGAAFLTLLGGVFAVLFVVASWDLADDVRFTLAVSETAALAVVAAVCFVGAVIVAHLNRP